MKYTIIMIIMLSLLACSETSDSTNEGLFAQQEVLVEQCQDGLDNDNDDKVDCEDEGCKGFTFCQEVVETEDNAVKCQDRIDNDGDEKIDCDDEDCKGFTFCVVEELVENTAVLCQDEIDNDNNGDTDCDDVECQGFTFCQPVLEDTAVKCQDTLDNDGDDKIDCDDEDCKGFTFCEASLEDTSMKCQDELDNDDDGKVDCDDENCWQFSFCNIYNGSPTTDSWGSTWDSIERGKKVWSEANTICENLGGRLPTATELYRNNATTGTGDIGQSINTEWLWTNISTYQEDNKVVIKVSNGETSNSNESTPRAFRCIWPNDDNSGFDEDRCNHKPGESCFKYDKYYNIDTVDRPALDYAAATNECMFYGASIPMLTEWSESIHDGLENGTNSWNWIGETIYWYNGGYGSPLLRWSEIGTKDWYYSNASATASLSYQSNKNYFRCIGLENQSFIDAPAENNCNGDCFVNNDRATKLISDSEDRETMKYTQAVELCRSLGGTLPNTREFIENLHNGWANGSNNWLWVVDHLYWANGGGYSGVPMFRWTDIANDHWFFQHSSTMTWTYMDDTHSFRCLWHPKKPDLPVCTNSDDILKWDGTAYVCESSLNGTSGGNAYGAEKIDPWMNAWDGTQRSQATYEDAKADCESLGGRLPTATEIYRINSNNPIEVSNIGTDLNDSWLWTSLDSRVIDDKVVVRISDGVTDKISKEASTPYRCIWPAKASDVLYGSNCLGMYEHECFVTDDFIADSYDRPAIDYAAAVTECVNDGGHLMNSREFINLIQQDWDHGSGNWLFVNEAGYWNSGNYGVQVVKWSGKNTLWDGRSDEESVVHTHGLHPFRCVYSKILK